MSRGDLFCISQVCQGPEQRCFDEGGWRWETQAQASLTMP